MQPPAVRAAPPAVRAFGDLSAGLTVAVPFVVDAAAMAAFAALSGDTSRVHHDAGFARANGFAGPVVYGALTVAQLSHVVGMHLPGDLGLATSWTVHFNGALYVDEAAELRAEVVHVSEATRTATLRFRVVAGERLIASGMATSKMLEVGSGLDGATGDAA